MGCWGWLRGQGRAGQCREGLATGGSSSRFRISCKRLSLGRGERAAVAGGPASRPFPSSRAIAADSNATTVVLMLKRREAPVWHVL